MTIKRNYGSEADSLSPKDRGRLIAYINLKLSSLGLPYYSKEGTAFLELANDMLANVREKDRLLDEYIPPVDARIQKFIADYLSDIPKEDIPRVPRHTFVLDHYGMAREISLPPDANEFHSPMLSTYRIRNGILNNPMNDRRTTKGVFHIAAGGLPVPLDKKEVPKEVFAHLLKEAFNPPEELSILPFTANEEQKAHCIISLLLRPQVRPEVPGVCEEKAMEIRFFAPATFAANLDFVESIFGNSGDPYIDENDAALDPLHWTGHTGCIVLAGHLTKLTKKELGLPKWDDATDRQKHDGMAYKDENELYNEGKPFKLCARNDKGVIVSIIADNYFGYSKKEVKAQISYSSNLLGLTEEEHSGGALVIPSYNIGNTFVPDTNIKSKGQTFNTVVKLLKQHIEIRPEGYAIDRFFPNIVYLPEKVTISIETQLATWEYEGQKQSLRILPNEIYIHPSGYRIQMDQHPGSGAWRLVGTAAEGLYCHKPCTVSGGGKSEISKSVMDAVTFGPLVTGDYAADLEIVKEVINYDYGYRFAKDSDNRKKNSRPILSVERSLGSVIKLLTPSPLYSNFYNNWLETIPERVKAFVFLIKRFYKPEWGNDWESHFGTDTVNGASGNIIKFEGRNFQAAYLRIGYTPEGVRSMHKLRQDFIPAQKIQLEDDITCSVIVPKTKLGALPEANESNPSVKFSKNCEARFFQRPDDAIIRGYDKQTEIDMSGSNNFISNFEPLTRARAKEMIEKTVQLSEFTPPMRNMIIDSEKDNNYQYFVVSANPRIVNGKPSKNPRYLQLDKNFTNPINKYISEITSRLYRQIPEDEPVLYPVGAVLPGRRNNPPEPETGIRPLAVYGPIHYQELPELFMDFVCSLTGKSPSTTGAGSEGALTKGPFNSLSPTSDLNNALLGFILTGYNGFTTAAGYIGHKYKLEHDISILVPELWSRLTPQERDPEFMKAHGYLEQVKDFEYKGKTIYASRLGWRITPLFASQMLGRLFDSPSAVFPEEMLRPELQNIDYFADGVLNITEAQAEVAKNYIADGSVEFAIPPLKAILHIMAEGTYNGKTITDPEIRSLFTAKNVLSSDWYKARINSYIESERKKLEDSKLYLEAFLAHTEGRSESEVLSVKRSYTQVQEKIKRNASKEYAESLIGTIGLDPLFRK